MSPEVRKVLRQALFNPGRQLTEDGRLFFSTLTEDHLLLLVEAGDSSQSVRFSPMLLLFLIAGLLGPLWWFLTDGNWLETMSLLPRLVALFFPEYFDSGSPDGCWGAP